MKKAILAVSFGTSYTEAETSCIRPVEDALRSAFPEYDVYRAFTSRVIMRKLRGQGTVIESEEEAIARLTADGYEEIIVVPTNIIPGYEYDKVCAAAKGFRLSAPLLNEDADLDWITGVLSGIAAEEGCTLLLMGHGTDHAANEMYVRLSEKLPENVLLACASGEHTLHALLPKLDCIPAKTVTLMPLMLVAGDHARNDLAGDEGNSWKSILTARGFDVRVRMQGLGALKEVQQHFVKKAARVI